MTPAIDGTDAFLLAAGLLAMTTVMWICFRMAVPTRRGRGTGVKGTLRMLIVALAVLVALDGVEIWLDYSERNKEEDVDPDLERMRVRCLGLINKRTSEPDYRPPSRTERYVCEKFPELVGQRAILSEIEKLR